MLEIARTLVMDPKIIMLDEPSIGLAPRIVDQVFAVVRRLAEAGKAILMVEQNVRKALSVSTAPAFSSLAASACRTAPRR